MDVHQKGYLCYAEFCQSCREMLFNGDIRSLWRELDANEKGIVTLKESSKGTVHASIKPIDPIAISPFLRIVFLLKTHRFEGGLP